MTHHTNIIFEKNIQALILKNSFLATRIFSIEGNSRYEVFQGKDPVDINILDTRTNEFIYQTPTQNILDYIEEHKVFERYPYRYFFGIGNGILLKMLLKSTYLKRIVAIEPDIELLYIIFNMIDFSEEIISERIEFDLAQEIDFVRALHYIGHPEGKIYLKLFQLETSSSYYTTVFDDLLESVHQTFLKAIEHNVTSHGNDIIDSLMGVEHHFKNLPIMIQNPKFQTLLTKRNCDTAIVVSTGPSLTKQLPLLKKIQDYVTIISVDASYPILEKHGIKPDIVTVLERVPTTANFFKNSSPEFQKDIIFLVVSIVHEEVLNAITTGTKILVMRPHEYTYYFGLHEFGYLGAGMSAANMAHEIAIAMEYKRVVLIGQDLSFADEGRSHAEGHFFGENEEDHSKFNLHIPRYGGEGSVKTTMYWQLFKDYFERTIVSTSGVIDTINATEGGARIEGAIELPFASVIESYVDETLPKHRITLDYPTLEEENGYQEQIIERTHHILELARIKQHHIEEVFLDVQKECEHLITLEKESRLEEINFDDLANMVTKIDTIKMFIDDHEFTTMFYDVMRSSLIHLELDIALLQVRPVKEDIEKKAKMIEWIMTHRYWLFLFAGAINSQREIMVRAITQWPESMKEAIHIAFEVEDLEQSSRELSDEEKEIYKMTWLQADGTYA